MRTLNKAQRNELMRLTARFEDCLEKAADIDRLSRAARYGHIGFDGKSIPLSSEEARRAGLLLARDLLEMAKNLSDHCEAEFGIRLVDEGV